MNRKQDCVCEAIVRYANHAIRSMLDDAFGGVIPHGTALRDLAKELVRNAECEAKLDTLRNDLKSANPNPDFHAELDRCVGLDGVPTGGRPRWYDNPLPMDMPLINREDLRLSLYDLLEREQKKVRLMIVRGEFPGKSYCRWLITHVASEIGMENPIVIDLLDISSVQNLAERLVDQLGLPRRTLDERFSTEIREGKYFNDWLVGQSREFGADKRWLLVFDHLAKPGVNQDVANAVLDLAKRALESGLTNVWVILLDCQLTDAIDQPGRYCEESVEALKRQEIEGFVDWVKELRRQAGDQDPQVPQAITTALASEFPLSKADLDRLRREIVRWVQRRP